MISTTPVNDSTFFLLAARNYNNICLDSSEFDEDLNRFKYIKKILYRYKKSGEINERLVLNHLVILYNVFDNPTCTRMLTFKLYHYLEEIFTFLDFLGILPENIIGIGEEDYIIKPKEYKRDEVLIKKLQEILKG